MKNRSLTRPGIILAVWTLCFLTCWNATGADISSVGPQVVVRVQGLTWPAVKGLGWGQSLAPVLVRLEELPEIERSFANRSGTLLRLFVSPTADFGHAVESVLQLLRADYRNPIQLSGDQLATALRREEWRDAAQMGELTRIEIRTLALRGGLVVVALLCGLSVLFVWWRRRAKHRLTDGSAAQ